MKRAFKYRFYPREDQTAELTRTFGCVRKVYNLALDARTTAWQEERRKLGYLESSALLTSWKRTDELAFLNEVAAVPLQQALRHLQRAFVNFWSKRAGPPRFKTRRRSRQSAEYTRSGFRWTEDPRRPGTGKLTLAKMALPLEIVWSRALPTGARPSTVTVSRDRAGRWFVSIVVQDPDVRELPLAPNPAVAVDLGLTDLAVLSTGEKIANPRHERRDRARLARAHRSLSRKQKGSRNSDKARRRIARIHARTADRRQDALHQLSTRLVRENQTIVIEDLNVGGMLKNHSLARAISDASWSKFREMLEYKCDWYGRTLVLANRWFPSSKLCSACGYSVQRLPLALRTWTCPACRTSHDRDVNAAENLLAAGLAVTACGDDVSRDRTAPAAQSSMKQESRAARSGRAISQGGDECQQTFTTRLF